VNPRVTVIRPQPVKPPIEKVVLELSPEDALALCSYLSQRTGMPGHRTNDTFDVYRALANALYG
jgi:hypothetical protein